MNERNDGVEHQLAEVLAAVYGLTPTSISRVPAGTATDNFVVEVGGGRRWFAKVYRDHSTVVQEQAAINLAIFARAGGVPVPEIRRTIAGGHVGEAKGVVLSLWDYVTDAETAEGGLTGERWANVGIVLGRLHRHLAGHPAGFPGVRPATGLRNLGQDQRRLEQLIAAYQHLGSLDEDQEWALNAALLRRSLLPKVEAILQRLPPLVVQIVHGDLASPNLLMRGDDVAALIDFQPPTPRYLAWEIARIGCDPQTILLNNGWLAGLSQLLDAYRQENPVTLAHDLLSTVAVGCAYTLASTYPLAAPLRTPTSGGESLMRYGRARHEAALRMLEVLDDASR